jgi:hypothetical protein
MTVESKIWFLRHKNYTTKAVQQSIGALEHWSVEARKVDRIVGCNYTARNAMHWLDIYVVQSRLPGAQHRINLVNETSDVFDIYTGRE